MKSNGLIATILFFNKVSIFYRGFLKRLCSQLHNDIQMKCIFQFQPAQVSVIKFPCWSHEAAHSIAGKEIAVHSLQYLLQETPIKIKSAVKVNDYYLGFALPSCPEAQHRVRHSLVLECSCITTKVSKSCFHRFEDF